MKVPRFLLNDIVRFWRTMAVDYASKRRDRAGKGWALRNFKLRLSRKLIFASTKVLEDFLVQLANRTPLNIIATFCLDFEAIDAGREIFESYEQFLAILDDNDKRDRLDSMDVEEANDDDLFQEARRIATSFQRGLTRLFFQSDHKLAEATQRYGVF